MACFMNKHENAKAALETRPIGAFFNISKCNSGSLLEIRVPKAGWFMVEHLLTLFKKLGNRNYKTVILLFDA